MSRRTPVRNKLAGAMQQAGRSRQVKRLASRATSWAQQAAAGHEQLAKVMDKVEDRLPPPSSPRPGSGDWTPLGGGRGGAIGITHPGADSSAKPGTPGQVLYGEEAVRINVGRDVITLKVINTADRPITVGSHFHFAEANPALEFDRKAAWGRRQNIISGGMTRFDPGAPQEVELVPFGGRRIAAGFRGECGEPLDG